MASLWTCFGVIVVFLIVQFRVLRADELEDGLKDIGQDKVPAMDQEKWRAIEPQESGDQDWIPSEDPVRLSQVSSEDEPVLKRRRPVRKRKRRPQLYEREFEQDDESYPDRLPARSRNRRPQRLDQRREQWRDEMMAEEPYRPLRNYNRRRLYPKYQEEPVQNDERGMYRDEESTSKNNTKQDMKIFDEEESTQSEVPEKIRDPYSALNQEQENRRRPYPNRKYIHRNLNEFTTVTENNITHSTDRIDTDSSNPVDLKTLLKQSENISLSELLQQKNLSLADLLKGEQHAISALTEIPEQASETYKHTKENKPKRYNSDNRRLPPIRKYQNQNENINTLTETTTKDTQEKYTQPLDENTFKVVESTTERRIFVPSHPKYYTSVDYKPNIMNFNTERIRTSTTTEPEKTSQSTSIVSSTITFSTSEYPPSTKSKSEKNRPRNALPTTLAKLKTLSAKTTMKSIAHNGGENAPKISTLPPKAFHININEIFGMPNSVNESKTTEGPLKISVNIDEMIKKSKESEVIFRNKAESEILLNDQPEFPENITQLNAKDEIMEILSDEASRDNLTRLLKLRNMTLEELIEQRERGSSQRHLADIFHNQTKEPEPSEETIVEELTQNIIKEPVSLYQPSLFDAFPMYDNPKLPKDTHYYAPVPDSKTRESRENQFPNINLENYKIVPNSIYQTTQPPKETINKFLPLWRQAYNSLNKNDQKLLSDKLSDDELIINDEAHRIEDIENRLAEAVNGALNVDVLEHRLYKTEDEDNEFLRLPYGVRSAIIASAVIGGISLCVFLTIFIIFKWTHRQRNHLSYTNSFSSSKIKTPMLQAPYQKRNFNTLMNNTLGRKKKICTIYNDPQSLQEYLWENDRKPFQ